MPPDPMDDVEFLARSAHRVEVLRTLVTGPRTRADLQEETGIPQPTLGRVLGGFADRHWVERGGHEYALTGPGRLVAAAFEDLLDAVATVQRLEGVVTLLPVKELPFGVERFADATVTTPAPGNVLRHVHRSDELISRATRLRILTNTMMPEALVAVHDRVVNPDAEPLDIVSVVASDAIDQALAVPRLAECVRGLVASGRSPVYRHEGPVPTTLALVDETALLAPTDDRGVPVALVESEDDAVRAWVRERFERARDRSTLLTTENLPE